jgi:hypothetical protein
MSVNVPWPDCARLPFELDWLRFDRERLALALDRALPAPDRARLELRLD